MRALVPAFAFVCFATAAACSGDPGAGGDDPTAARIISFEASPMQIQAGETATLSWKVEGANGVTIEPTVGLAEIEGSAPVRPIATTTYTLTVKTLGDDLTSQVTIVVAGGPPTIEAFTATPQTIAPGDASMLAWSTSNATHVVIEPGLGRQPAIGGVSVRPEVTTSYRLTAVGDAGSVVADVQVVVASGGQPRVLSFTATPQTVQPGAQVTLRWQTVDATSVSIDGGLGQKPASGEAQVSPMQTTTYNLTAVGPGGVVNASVTVMVLGAGDPSIIRLDAQPPTIAAGGSSLISWETDNATHVTLSGVSGTLDAKGDHTVMPAATTTYTLTAFGNGKQVTREVTVTVAGAGTPVVLEFTAQPQAIALGAGSTLTWRTQNATSVDIDNGGGAGLGANDSVQVTPARTTTYTLTARGGNGTATAQVTITVQTGAPVVVSFTAQPTSILAGQAATISWQTMNATGVTIDNGVGGQPASGSVQVNPSQTTLYTLTATGPGGSASALLTLTVGMQGAPVIATFTAMPQQIAPGGQAVLAWQTTGAASVMIDNGIGIQPTSGQVTVMPSADTTYTLTAAGPGGNTSAQVTVRVVSTTGDQCSNAFTIAQSGQITGNTLTAVNDYSPATGGCTRYAAAGPDVVYRVALRAGDRLQASLQPGMPSWDASLYLVRNCGDIAQSCVAGEDNGNPEMIDYTAAADGDYFLIVDGYSASSGGPYTLDVQLNAAPIANDRCMGAIDATMGGAFMGSTRGAMNDYDPGTGGCTRYAEASGDVTYRVQLQAGERIQASLDATWDAALYLVSSCTNVVSSCAAGQDDGNPEQIDHRVTAAGTYYLIVDGYATNNGSFTLNVSISPPVQGGDTCMNAVPVPGGGGSFQSTTVGLTNDYEPPVACTGYPQRAPDQVYAIQLAAGDVVDATVAFESTLDGSLYLLTGCANIQMSCAAGADRGYEGDPEDLRHVARAAGTHYLVVDASNTAWTGAHDLTIAHYGGDTCPDAPPLQLGNVPEWFLTSGRTNDYSPNSGGCTGYSASAEDRAYSVRLNAGDQLQVTVEPNTGYDPSVYLVSNCSDVNGSCVAGTDRTGNRSETLAALVQQTGTYYLILDGFLGSDGSGTLTATVARGETCRDAYLIPPAGGTFAGTTSSYRHDYGINTRTGSCTGWQQEGPEAVYRVSLEAGRRLQASLTTSWDASLYLITDCAAAATSCVAGEDNGNPEQIDYTNSGASTRTYYLVVDSWRAGVSGNYSLSVTIQ